MPPAYDIVAYSAYNRRCGHALHILPEDLTTKPKMPVSDAPQGKAAKPGIGPVVIRKFCAELGIPEKPASAVVRQTVADAVRLWPEMIAVSLLTRSQKSKLLGHFNDHPLVKSVHLRAHGSRSLAVTAS